MILEDFINRIFYNRIYNWINFKYLKKIKIIKLIHKNNYNFFFQQKIYFNKVCKSKKLMNEIYSIRIKIYKNYFN